MCWSLCLTYCTHDVTTWTDIVHGKHPKNHRSQIGGIAALEVRPPLTTTWIQSGFNQDGLKLDLIHINRVRTILRSVVWAPRYYIPVPCNHASNDFPQNCPNANACSINPPPTNNKVFLLSGQQERLIHCKPVTAADRDPVGLLVGATLQVIATDADQGRYLTSPKRSLSTPQRPSQTPLVDFHGHAHNESSLNPVESTSLGGSTESEFDPD